MEQIGSPALRIIENLARMIEQNQRAANQIADKIGTDQHTKHLGADYEDHAETAQDLAGRQTAWERLHDMRFVR